MIKFIVIFIMVSASVPILLFLLATLGMFFDSFLNSPPIKKQMVKFEQARDKISASLKKTFFPKRTKLLLYKSFFGSSASKKVYTFQKKHQDPLIEKAVLFYEKSYTIYQNVPSRRQMSTLFETVRLYFSSLSKGEALDVLFKHQPLLISSIEIWEEHLENGIDVSEEILSLITTNCSSFCYELYETKNALEKQKELDKEHLLSTLNQNALDKLSKEKDILREISALEQKRKS